MYILVVEDDARIANLVERALRGAGHRADVVHDGAEGLTRAELGSYDLIVLDVMLPGMDGFAVARELRKHKVRVPILMLTARDAVADRVVGLDAGADDYLTKPFALEELLARVRALARRPADVVDAEVLRVGDLAGASTSWRRPTAARRASWSRPSSHPPPRGRGDARAPAHDAGADRPACGC